MKGLNYIIILAIVPLVSSNCYVGKDRNQNCSFHIQCDGIITAFSLPAHCQGSPNYPVTIELTLTHATESFAYNTGRDMDLLASITTLRASGIQPTTNLSMLEYMPRLQHLYLDSNNIKNITGSPFFTLSRLSTIDLSYNSLSCIDELFQFEMPPNRVKKLSLAHNAIEQLPGDAFAELASLTELDLSYNKITNLDEDPFDNLTILQTLKLSNNKIKNFNHAFARLFFLQHLFLKDNLLSDIDIQSLGTIYELETLDVSGNSLSSIKPVVFSRHWTQFGSNSVCKIILSHNHLVFVPNATSDLLIDRYKAGKVDVMTQLDLSYNDITDIQFYAFKSLAHLVSLDLSNNKIINFDVDPYGLKYVTYLNLSSNYITHLNVNSFWLMGNLLNLDLSHNFLHNLPDQIFYSHYLKYVNMSHNEFTNWKQLRIKIFHPLGGLLDLSNNSIAKFRIPYGEALGLRTLIFRFNNISDPSIINLIEHRELESLDMSCNLIKELDDNSLLLPASLINLNLNFNNISKMAPASFHKAPKLRKLLLSHNNITKIEYGSFQGLSNLLHLDLSFNNIKYLDSKVMVELKSLQTLSLKFNGLEVLEYKSWLTHKYFLNVYLEGNSFSCDWLETALSDFNNGYSRMRPTVMEQAVAGHSLEGIPCINIAASFTRPSVLADDRLLAIVKKILDAVLEQNKLITEYKSVQIQNKNDVLDISRKK